MRKIMSLLLVIGALLAALGGPALAQAPLEGRVLVWEYIANQDDGQLEVLTPAGVAEVLVDFQPGVYDNWAKRCSQDHWSEGGQGVALFAGAAQGSLAIYPLAGGTPVSLGSQVSRMACAGPQSFQFSPNGKRAGYIDYAYDVVDRDYAEGNLVFFDAATGTQQGAFDWATSFMLYDDGALMFRVFPGEKEYGTEGDVDWWDGSSRKTLVTLTPIYPDDAKDMKCGIKSGSVARVGDTAYILAGQWCENSVSGWQLVSVPMSGGDATRIAAGPSDGGFFPESFTTELVPARDGSGFLVALPSGLERNTVELLWINPAGQITKLLEGQHVIADRFGERLSEGRHMMLAPDGSAIAFVTATADQEQTLWLLDLNTIGGTPVQLDERGQGQRIFQYVWSANNRLYYIVGNIESNTLKVVTPGSSPERISRGRFFQLAVTYDGGKVAAAEWFANPNSIGDDLFRVTLLDTNGNSLVLKEGGADHAQMVPLAIQ